MDIVVFNASELPLALRALTRVSDSPRGRQLRDVLAQLHHAEAPDAGPARPEEVAAGVLRPHARTRLVQLAIVAALVDGTPTRAAVAAVRDLARALAVAEPGLAVLRHLAAGRRRIARVLQMRRLFARIMGDAWRAEGLAGVRRIVAPMFFGGGFDRDVQWRFRQLGLLAPGTLGRALWAHCTERRFGFPGENGGFPARLVFHDVGHLLTGFSTEAPGEIQQGAFQAGFVRRDGFSFLLFVILQFHLGVKVTPVAPAAVGLFDIPRVMHAVARGATCPDLSDGWSLWDVAERPLEELRAAYGIVAG